MTDSQTSQRQSDESLALGIRSPPVAEEFKALTSKNARDNLRAIGVYFERLRITAGHGVSERGGDKGLYAFAKKYDIDPTYLSRIESAERLPSQDVLKKIRPAVAKFGTPGGLTALIFLWLEAQGLDEYVTAIQQGR